MKTFRSISPDDFNRSPFHLINNDWMLITAESGGRVNSMTASWGGLGIMWGKKVSSIVLRPQRFTKVLLDEAETYSLSFLDHQKYARLLGYMGSVSGHDEDKIKGSGVTVRHEQNTPFIEEATTVILCRKLSRHHLGPDGFIDPTIDSTWYPNKDYHYLYLGEILDILDASEVRQ